MPHELITSLEGLPASLASGVAEDEAAYVAGLARKGGAPFAVTAHFASLARSERNDPIRRLFFPDPREALPDPFALDDPLGEARYRAASRLVHQYPDRALLLAGGECAGYCRHCFRRLWVARRLPFIGGEGVEVRRELESVLAYLRTHEEIREVLVSGGDPLTVDDSSLEALFARLREARPGAALRVCTRVPVSCPQRVTAETVALLSRWRPLRLALHINHCRELSSPTREVLAACVNSGVPVLTQTVLLRGVNDDRETLGALFAAFAGLALSPYYLFQLDLAPGTAHFRVPLEEGLALYRSLEKPQGAPLPVYAVDLPGGGGKIRLSAEAVAGFRATPHGEVLLLKDAAGRLWSYPRF